MTRKRIGVLALQGAFREHRRMLEGLGADTRLVRWPAELDGLDGLVIPGGESTAIAKLLEQLKRMSYAWIDRMSCMDMDVIEESGFHVR